MTHSREDTNLPALLLILKEDPVLAIGESKSKSTYQVVLSSPTFLLKEFFK